MEENFNKNKELGNQLINFFKENKKKIFTILLLTLIISITFIFFNIQSKKHNSIVAEKYIQAGIFLSLKENEKSKKIYEEIIKSENKFYLLLLFLL